jgi:alkylmercury lyase-like protein
MLGAAEEQDVKVRAAVYEAAMAAGVPPTVAQLARSLDLPPAAVRESLERLAAGKALVLQRESREVLMANPFSAVPTPFAVYANDRLYYGNCIWDALGIPAMLQADARIDCSCGCCGEAMQLTVRAGQLGPVDGVVHFAIPAHRWWQDIVYN